MEKTCCNKKPKGFLSGFLYGLVPHIGCIAFIVFTVLGVSTATAFFRPLLMSRYFFYGLILLSLVFTTISAAIYLKKNNLLSYKGIRQKKRYLSIMYGTSIGVNLLLFLVIFPMTANITGAVVAVDDQFDEISLDVDIPCPGHAPLISNSLKELKGIKSVKFKFPSYFYVIYDSKEITKEKMLSLDVFESYPAEIIDEKINDDIEAPKGCSSCNSCSGACGGNCGI